MKVGINLSAAPGYPPGRLVELTRRAEARGFATAWYPESNQQDAIGMMHAGAMATEQIALASGVIPIQTRSPALVAMGASTLSHLAPGRIRLGIGHSSPNVVAKWNGRQFTSSNPLGQITEFIEAFRLCFSGERADYEGEYFSVDGFRLRLPPAGPVEVVVAALQDQMAEHAARIADGVLFSYILPERLEHLVPRLRRAAEGRRATEDTKGRSGDLRICLYLTAAITSDPDSVALSTRRVLVSYSTVDAYAAVFALAGFADEVAEVRRLWESGDRNGAVEAVPIEMCRTLGAFGDADEVNARVADYIDAGADEVTIGIAGDMPAEEMIGALRG